MLKYEMSQDIVTPEMIHNPRPSLLCRNNSKLNGTEGLVEVCRTRSFFLLGRGIGILILSARIERMYGSFSSGMTSMDAPTNLLEVS